MCRVAANGLVDRGHGPFCQSLPPAGKEAQIRDQSPQEKLQPQIQRNLCLQKPSLRVS